MNSVYIYHHLGLGDHIIANGMVRTIYKNYDKTFLFCKPQNLKNISFMYRDLPGFKIITFDDPEVKSFMNTNKTNNYIIAGHEPFEKIYRDFKNKLRIDEIFYSLAGVPIENKIKEFYIPRDIEKEKWVFSQLGLKEGEKFAFFHDSEKRKITKNIPDIKIIRPTNMDWSIFDFIYTIENASEIHCVNSSFFCLIDCSENIKKEKMYLHKYAIPNTSEKLIGRLRDIWTIIE